MVLNTPTGIGWSISMESVNMAKVTVTLETTPAVFPSGQTLSGYRFALGAVQNDEIGLTSVFNNVPVGTQTVVVQMLDNTGTNFGTTFSTTIDVNDPGIYLDAPTGLTFTVAPD